jgi:predicted ribosomally synthesized peptide with SipW-like signal peptide
MTISTTTAASARDARRARNRRLKAILAGGLVLGVGAAVTLAAWNDSEFAQGTFTAGQFNLEGSVDGDLYTENDALGTPAELDFTVPTLNLAPDDVVSAAFAIRLDDTTTNPANAVISAPVGGTTGDLAGLTYSLTQTAEFGCDQDVTGTLVVPGSAVGSVPGAPSVPLAIGADAEAGAPVYVCFTVTADGDLEEGQSGTATWQFLATSVDVPVIP